MKSLFFKIMLLLVSLSTLGMEKSVSPKKKTPPREVVQGVQSLLFTMLQGLSKRKMIDEAQGIRRNAHITELLAVVSFSAAAGSSYMAINEKSYHWGLYSAVTFACGIFFFKKRNKMLHATDKLLKKASKPYKTLEDLARKSN